MFSFVIISLHIKYGCLYLAAIIHTNIIMVSRVTVFTPNLLTYRYSVGIYY